MSTEQLLSAGPLLLFTLILLSAFFSGSETSMMSLNRYRLKHLAKEHKRAALIQKMLKRPDRLLGIILIGNTFANILASAVATLLAVAWFGEGLGVPIATVGLTLVLLIFAEVSPKTLAAFYPERFAAVVVYPLWLLSMILRPLVVLVNGISNTFLRLFGAQIGTASTATLNREELRSLVTESGTVRQHLPKAMLLGVLDLEKVSVDDIMIPRTEVASIDLDAPWELILKQLSVCQHTLLPVHRGDINDVIGVLHTRFALNCAAQGRFNPQALLQSLSPPYFIPEGTPLQQQLLEFKTRKARLALVVDEYGDVQGIVTLADILEEIVGEFTTDIASSRRDIHPQEDGSFLVEGSTNIRDLNRMMSWTLPQDDAKTLSGYIIHHLESIPEGSVSFQAHGLIIEVVQIKDNLIKTVRIRDATT